MTIPAEQKKDMGFVHPYLQKIHFVALFNFQTYFFQNAHKHCSQILLVDILLEIPIGTSVSLRSDSYGYPLNRKGYVKIDKEFNPKRLNW